MRDRSGSERKANQTIDDFLRIYVDEWDGITDVTISDEFLFGDRPDYVSAEGSARTVRPNFLTFMKDEQTRSKVKQLLSIRKTGPLDYTIPAKLERIGLLDYLEKFPFTECGGNKPQLYCHRLLIMMYPEFFTSVAKDGDLKKAQRLFRKKGTFSFEKLQYQLRANVDSYLGLAE